MECRYLGQGFELRAKMPSEELTKDNVNVIIDNFMMSTSSNTDTHLKIKLQ